MRSYGQFCPVAKAAELFCERWTALIIRDLALGATRFRELQRGVPLASPTILSRRLAQLVAEGVIERRRAAEGGRWTYHLTEAGRDFVPVVMALGTWGQRWSRRALAAHEVDLGLLLWAVERGAHAEAFGPGRSVIELQFPEQPEHKRRWWFLNEAGRTELCVEPPGPEVDLYLRVRLTDLILIWRGDLSLRRALAEGQLEAHGARTAVRALPGWLGLSPLAHVAFRRPGP
ncbi:MAG: winged helix-turn-helix transcriptional regulator [Geminicoccaceae bacterium]